MPPPGVCQNIMSARQTRDGYGTIKNPDRYFQQDYQELRQYCLIRGVKYIDDTFPPDRSSIGQGKLSPAELAQVQWLRPERIAPDPAFVVDGLSRFDFGQGKIGNCWFLASIGALTFQNHILRQVVPLEQTFKASDYCGLFHFRFWRFGRWVDVVIDDKLPTINGKLIFVRSKDKNEFWPALLEKAYAKVCGSYTDMNAGTPSEAMRDFTGGVHMCIDLRNPPSDLWELFCRAAESQTLMSSSTLDGAESSDAPQANGLIPGHSYTVSGFNKVVSQGTAVKVVRLWNPWGFGEWNGDWSDRSPLWKTVSSKERNRRLSVAEDGEFWMSLDDFCRFFSELDICGLVPDFLDGDSSSHWKTFTTEGRWVAGTTAGGCMDHPETFWTNPQFRIKIFGKPENNRSKNALVSLMQKPNKRNRCLVQKLFIGFFVFEYKAVSGKFPAAFFRGRAPVAHVQTFLNSREVVEFLTLKPGEYLIVPCTYTPNESGSFLLSIFCREETQCYENSGQGSMNRMEKFKNEKKQRDVENPKKFFRQYSDKYDEVDAEQLQKLLNENILKGDLKCGGFSVDACRSMVAQMDSSVTGRLNSEEFVRLWNKVLKYRDVFHLTDTSKTGTLSLSELRNAFIASEMKVSDDMLNLLALRYGASSGHMTLESFIALMLRLDCMRKIFRQLFDGSCMKLEESEWTYLYMYS